MAYRTIGEIRDANRAAGQHWFDAGTMRFFGSRVGHTVYGGRYFVSSEQDRGVTVSDGTHVAAWGGQRRYTVHVADDGGRVETVGEFGEHETRAQAIAAIRRILRAEVG